MNTQTQEALKMAIEDAMKFVNTLNGYEDANQSKPFKTEADKYLSYASVVIKSLATSLQEALAQPLRRDWKETIDERIAKDNEFKEALAQPAQEPYGFINRKTGEFATGGFLLTNDWEKRWLKLYTHPAPSWQGLSNERIREIGEQCELNNNGTLNWIDFARAIEKKHGIG